MTSKQRLEADIEATMNSLDNLVPATPALFFYTRLSARLDRREQGFWARCGRLITRPVVAALGIVFVVTVNVATVLHNRALASAAPDQAEIAVADEYNRTTSLYNIDNVQP